MISSLQASLEARLGDYLEDLVSEEGSHFFVVEILILKKNKKELLTIVKIVMPLYFVFYVFIFFGGGC